MLPCKIVIPARYASTRLPGKPLLALAGKPMVQWVYERAAASGAEEVWIATDDVRIAEVARGFGAPVCLTRAEHASGTERLAEVAGQRGWPDDAIVVNLQGDEPLMPPALLGLTAAALAADAGAAMATVCARIHTAAEVFNPNVVKLVRDAAGRALYFSRAPIPWQRDAWKEGARDLPAGAAFYRHIGLYAYRAGFLRCWPELAPSPLEQAESLEQLRALWHGHAIAVIESGELPGPGVDTPEDVPVVEQWLRDG
jgi:3-deoxy-manno-octulosonate cytidylyltransferase (CMP-KDO synthetase)